MNKYLKIFIIVAIIIASFFPIFPKKMLWLNSYETAAFDTLDEDLDLGEYATEHEGYWFVRDVLKSEGQFVSTTSPEAIKNKREVKMKSSRAYYTEFQDSRGTKIRIKTTKEEYEKIKNEKDYPQPVKWEFVNIIGALKANAAITFDATANDGVAGSASSISWSHTVGGSNKALFVGAIGQDGIESDCEATTATYNGDSMTKSTSSTSNSAGGRSNAFYIVPPDSGTNTVSVNFAGVCAASLSGSISFNGVDQSDPIDTSGSTDAGIGFGEDATITLSVDTGSLVAAAALTYENDEINILPGTDTTEAWEIDASGPDVNSVGGYESCSGSSCTINWTWTGGETWAMSAIVFNDFVLSDAPKIKLHGGGSAGASWYSTSWGSRKQITVDHNKVSGSSNLTDFPMLFSVTDPNLKHTDHGGKMGKVDATDLLFTSSDGTTKLSHQIEYYASTTGEIIAWVKVPTLLATADTILYAYFGNSGASDQQDSVNVWDTNYKYVGHFSNGTTLSVADSTSGGNTPTNNNGVSATIGKIDGGAGFVQASSQELTGTQTAVKDITGDLTLSAWVKTPSTGSYKSIIVTGSNYYFFLIGLNLRWWDGSEHDSGHSITADTWTYVTGVKSSNTVSFYVNGSFISSFASLAGSSFGSWYIGSVGGQYFDGTMDEARISATARSADWIATEYANQNSPSSFYSYGGLGANSIKDSSGNATSKFKIRGGVKFR